jgi:hypothetical protein
MVNGRAPNIFNGLLLVEFLEKIPALSSVEWHKKTVIFQVFNPQNLRRDAPRLGEMVY